MLSKIYGACDEFDLDQQELKDYAKNLLLELEK